jgi:hypothetical protein
MAHTAERHAHNTGRFHIFLLVGAGADVVQGVRLSCSCGLAEKMMLAVSSGKSGRTTCPERKIAGQIVPILSWLRKDLSSFIEPARQM